MSHFSVLVIGENVTEQLQPYHEFECTGTDDKYVQDVDVTEEARAAFAKCTRSMLRKLADGSLHDFFDAKGEWRPEFSRPDEKDSLGCRRRVKFVPEGYEETEVDASTQESLAEWAADYYGTKVVFHGDTPDKADAHKYGYILTDDAGNVTSIIDRTNPNKTWDWWQVGGRWSGFLRLKNGANGVRGKKGLLGSCANDGPGRADIARKCDVDFEGMRNDAGEKAGAKWDKAQVLTAGVTWESWSSIYARLGSQNVELARTTYHEQPSVKALRESKDDDFSWDIDDTLAGSREAYVPAARNRACSPYALVMNSEWISKGRMGWFGMSDDKLEQDEWDRKVNELLDSLPDDTALTIVDCHI